MCSSIIHISPLQGYCFASWSPRGYKYFVPTGQAPTPCFWDGETPMQTASVARHCACAKRHRRPKIPGSISRFRDPPDYRRFCPQRDRPLLPTLEIGNLDEHTWSQGSLPGISACPTKDQRPQAGISDSRSSWLSRFVSRRDRIFIAEARAPIPVP